MVSNVFNHVLCFLCFYILNVWVFCFTLISCLGFLKLPEDINEYWEEEDKDHNAYGGYTDFRYGTVGLNCSNNFKVKPKVGDIYMFPSWLDHMVYPFKSKYKFPDEKGERRSFSFNISFTNV